VLEDCTAELEDVWLAEAEPCRADCQDPEAAACLECLTPYVESWKAGAKACVADACGFDTPARQARRESADAHEGAATTAQADNQITAEAWWVRQCSSPCCYLDLVACDEDERDEWAICMAAAVASCFAAGPFCAGAALACMAKLAYDDAKCHARYGCLDDTKCYAGDICCAQALCNGKCCSSNQVCNEGSCKCKFLQCEDICCHQGAVGCDGSYCQNECDIRGDCGG
jgi:hypothetical protein